VSDISISSLLQQRPSSHTPAKHQLYFQQRKNLFKIKTQAPDTQHPMSPASSNERPHIALEVRWRLATAICDDDTVGVITNIAWLKQWEENADTKSYVRGSAASAHVHEGGPDFEKIKHIDSELNEYLSWWELSGEEEAMTEALLVSARVGCVKVVAELIGKQTCSQVQLDKVLDPSQPIDWPIRLASQSGHIDMIKLLLDDERVDPATRDNETIMHACDSGNLEVVQLLAKDHRIDPVTSKNAILAAACQTGNSQVVQEMLIDPDVDPSIHCNSALKYATDWQRHEIVGLLLKDGRVDPAFNQNEAVRSASEYGDYRVVKQLARDYRVDVAAGGNSAMLLANENKHVKVVRILQSDARVWVLPSGPQRTEDGQLTGLGQARRETAEMVLLCANRRRDCAKLSDVLRDVLSVWAAWL
jgi:hypothetical protein